METSLSSNKGQKPERKEVVIILFYLKKPGSVTVFLTMIFLLVFSLLGVTYDCARMSAARGYVKVAGSSAARTVFGNYNQELFQEYGLFGYGGCDGMGWEDLNREFLQTLKENLQFSQGGTLSGTDIYRIYQLQSSIENCTFLTDKDVFCGQVSAFLKGKAVSDMANTALGKIKGTASSTDLEGQLDMAEKYESGDYEALREAEKASGESPKEGREGQKESEKSEKKEAEGQKSPRESQKGGDEGQKVLGESRDSVKDSAGGNPLEAFSQMMRDGVLGMVCREENLSEKEIISRGGGGESRKDGDSSEKGAADFLKQFLKNEDPLEDVSQMSKGKRKLLLLAYDREVCSNYLSEGEEGIRYALEYITAGKKEEKSNLASVISRLLAVRTLLNFAYVAMDPALQEKSLATATALAGFTGLPPVITGVQYTILLILSFQEACVDVTALLDGKAVPVIKNSTNFKMKYEEICLGSKSLFQKKAAKYGKEKGGAGLNISYEEYLTVFLLLVGEDMMFNRTLDVIQQDLREKYNQSFCIDDCICESAYQITYQTDYVFKELPLLDQTQWGQSGAGQCQEVSYGYKSG